MAAGIERAWCSGADVTLVWPVASEAGLAALDALLDHLPEPRTGFEVVCNDWGAFETVLARPQVTPVLGRLLSRQCTDPRFVWITDHDYQTRFEMQVPHISGASVAVRYQPPSAAVLHHLRTPIVANPNVLSFFAGLRVTRFEISNLLQGVEFVAPEPWRVTLHTPTVIVALRRCPAAEEGRCGAPCRDAATCVDSPAFPIALYMTSDAVFYCNSAVNWTTSCPAIDRLVVTPPSRLHL
jgi:hypothetical protein